jgi:CubicO group peptidase (beta-lactamase class C family)
MSTTRRDFMKSALLLPSALAGSGLAYAQPPAASALFADFESGNFDGWTVEGNAFGSRPATDAAFPGKIRGFSGKGYASSFHPTKGNAATGKLISREFTIDKPFLTAKIGGGNHPNQACLNVVVDNKIVASATGNGTPNLSDVSLDLSAHVGKTARLEIVDNTTSTERGYVLVDDIQFTNGNPETPAIDFDNLRYQGMVTEMAERWRRDFGLPGVWCAFIKNGRVQALVANGFRNIETKDAANTKDHLPVGSISKVITGSLLAFFVAEGTIKYETTISEVFPELAHQYKDSPLLNATLRNLLTHSAGLPRGPDASFDVSGTDYRLNTLKKFLADERCTAPNAVSLYSNQGAPIAVAMVERLSGTTFESWVHGSRGKRIGLSDPHQINVHPNETFPHSLENGTARVWGVQTIKPYAFAPQGAYSLTLEDICAFASFTLTNRSGLSSHIYRNSVIGPTKGLPKEDTLTDSSKVPNRARTDAGWAFNDGMRYLYHNGQISGHYAELWVSPSMRQGFAFYTNCVEKDRPFMKVIGKEIFELRFMQ